MPMRNLVCLAEIHCNENQIGQYGSHTHRIAEQYFCRQIGGPSQGLAAGAGHWRCRSIAGYGGTCLRIRVRRRFPILVNRFDCAKTFRSFCDAAATDLQNEGRGQLGAALAQCARCRRLDTSLPCL
jgi:hypothetical protein